MKYFFNISFVQLIWWFFNWIIFFFIWSVGFCFLGLQYTLPAMAHQHLLPEHCVYLRRNHVCFPQYLRLTFRKVLLVMSLQKVWKSIWGHNKITKLLGWMMGRGHFFALFNNRQETNYLCILIKQNWFRQNMTGQFGNLWSQMPLEFIANPKQTPQTGVINAWSAGKSHAKANSGPLVIIFQWGGM